ncbi:hypothetical protein [Mesorhizobium sp. B2-3-5]|nr:hypothetical protein [Mesorhizobium sp. B2-3-5]
MMPKASRTAISHKNGSAHNWFVFSGATNKTGALSPEQLDLAPIKAVGAL